MQKISLDVETPTFGLEVETSAVSLDMETTQANLAVTDDETILRLNEQIASYSEIVEVLKAYILWLFEKYQITSTIIFCNVLPDVGEAERLYIDMTALKAYVWDGEKFEVIAGGDSGITVATDEEVDEALDDYFK